MAHIRLQIYPGVIFNRVTEYETVEEVIWGGICFNNGYNPVSSAWVIETFQRYRNVSIQNIDLQVCYANYDSLEDDCDMSMAEGLAGLDRVERVWASEGSMRYNPLAKTPWTEEDKPICLLEKDAFDRVQVCEIGTVTLLLPWEQV